MRNGSEDVVGDHAIQKRVSNDPDGPGRLVRLPPGLTPGFHSQVPLMEELPALRDPVVLK